MQAMVAWWIRLSDISKKIYNVLIRNILDYI